jgi:hypothetical protein
MSKYTNSYVERYVDLFHLWHGRTDGWVECHARNEKIQKELFKIGNKAIAKLNSQLTNKYGSDWSGS